ncbi:MAG TPA: aminoacyl-tRNA hydrolase [Bacteroidetes bacterium]|nr:aminoacyl-tRNA hydrolase [Bacteroidota bacterium]
MKFLIAGLGNIGDEYTNTRHNIGFKIVEALAEDAGASFFSARLADHCTYRWKGKSIHLIKPVTYMNESGKAVRYWMNEYQIPIENILVIVDDLALPFGKLRLKANGSDGGHNGLTSVQQLLNSQNYPRLRFGIGNEFRKGSQVNYVLGEWNADEKKILNEKIKSATEAVKNFISIGIERSMNLINLR